MKFLKNNSNIFLNSEEISKIQLITGPNLSRRKFIGNLMLVTAGATLISYYSSSNWEIGCYTRPWARYDYHTAFDGIARAGFKFVGLMSSNKGLLITSDTTTRQANSLRKDAKSKGLKIISAYGGIDVRKSVTDGIAGLKRVIDNLNACSCPNLLLGGISNPELEDQYYEVVAECCDYAAEKGVGISIKPHGGLNATGRECRGIVGKVNHKNFGLTYDPGNIYYYSDGKLDPVEDAREVDGLVVGMCVKDFLPPKNVEVTPGTGLVDFSKVLENLQEGGFTKGPLIVECLSTSDDLDYINIEAKKARQFLEKLTG